jgi:hypothetical protein
MSSEDAGRGAGALRGYGQPMAALRPRVTQKTKCSRSQHSLADLVLPCPIKPRTRDLNPRGIYHVTT